MSPRNFRNQFVVLREVTKKYGGLTALKKISFEIGEGEIFGYIGPNGAGKTTTMKILVGLLTDFEGEVYIGGFQVPKQKSEVHKLLGYLPQSVGFQEWRTVDHALKTFGKLSGLTETEIEKRITEVLDLLALSEVRHKKIAQLSGGMTQKVGLGQAILHNPKLLILDEPLNGLDPLSRYQFKEVLLKLSKGGTTILFSSHILSDVQDVADRIGIINRGQIKQVGTLNELKEHLAEQRTVEVLLTYATDKWREFQNIKHVKSVEQPSVGRILVNIEKGSDPDDVMNDLAQLIVKQKIRIRGINLLSPSLDDIYQKYVQEGESI
ncbi:MAG: ABC transporter ATP-binding protein [Candidatus Bathyarchaeota archaeon]|nr:ABC transporter ATP-binding protein [Candidatus Bathyarchaeota archaeon]